MDTRTPEQRRHIMQSVKTRNTGPELVVRRLLRAMRLRYRGHRKGLRGTPDFIFPKFKVAMFVHGCFWHGHGCPKGRLPKSGLDYWAPKIERNRTRDAAATKALRKEGWRVITVWQCQTKNAERLERRFAKVFHMKMKGVRSTGRRAGVKVGRKRIVS